MAARKQPFAAYKLPMMLDDSHVFDGDNPFSLLELCPPAVKAAIERLDPKYYKMSELELRRFAKPSAEIARLRMSFWDEYLRASEDKRNMDVRAITRGVCSHNYFYEVVLANENWLGYITIPPSDYQLAIREMLELSWDRIREVLLLPITEKVPMKTSVYNEEKKRYETFCEIVEKPNTKLIGEIRQITNMLDLRIKGAVLQRMQIEQRNLNINASADDPNVFLADATMAQLESMEKKIARMRGEMNDVEKLDAAKDIIEISQTEQTPDGLDVAEESASPATEENKREEA